MSYWSPGWPLTHQVIAVGPMAVRFVRDIFLPACVASCLLGCQAQSEKTRVVQDPSSERTETVPATHVPLFDDVTSKLGVSFVHRSGGSTPHFMPRSIGSGCAVLDFDNDGRYDLLFMQNDGPDSIHKNQLYWQTPTGTFQDVSSGCGLDVTGYGMGAAVGDVNNDGHVDVLLTEFGRIRLFLNRSSGSVPSFVDITESAQLLNPSWGTSATFVDYDRDGWLDLVVVNYVNYDPTRWCADASGRRDFCGPQTFPPVIARLFRNLSSGPSDPTTPKSSATVRFEDVTVTSGIAVAPGAGLGVTAADFNDDHWPDLLVANDGMSNFLWINQQDGTFRDEAVARGIAFNRMGEAEANMGIAIGDIDLDGRCDLFVTHRNTETHTLWSQTVAGRFVDRTPASGILASARFTGFGTAFGDWDNDGDLDMAVANGDIVRSAQVPTNVRETLDPFWHPYAQPNQVFINNGKGQFHDASGANKAVCEFGEVSRGLATVDFDNDGRLDIVTTTIDGHAHIFQNIAPSAGHWITVQAVDPTLNRDAYGAEVHVQTENHTAVRYIQPGSSYLVSNDPRAHFGLGHCSLVGSIRVVWPDGYIEMFPGGAADRHMVVQKFAGSPLNQNSSAASPEHNEP